MSSASGLACFRATVRGWVQGVYFRDFVRHHATALGLKGYVRNLSGSRAVEVRAEGERPQLERLLEHLHRGPRAARVEEVDVEWDEYTGDFSDFTVRY